MNVAPPAGCAHAFLRKRNEGTCPICEPNTARAIDPRVAVERLRAIRACNAREKLADFVRQAWHETDPTVPLDWNWHHELLCSHLQAMFEDWQRCRLDPENLRPKVQNLLINIPPGTAKSRIVSVFFPAWCWLHEPGWRVICLSANPDVATRDAPIARNLIESVWYRTHFKPQWTLDESINARDWYVNTAGGERRSFGITAKIVGLRADCIIVDDPNDPKDVHSEASRNAVNNAWDQAIANRLNDLRVGLRIGVMQRVHEDDWSAHVLRQGFDHLRLPLIYDPDGGGCPCEACKRGETLLGFRDPRADGSKPAVLHPVRFPEHVIEAERKKGSLYFAGQFGQRPAPADGVVFSRKWFKYIDAETMPKFESVVISCDLANSSHESKKNSNNALVVCARGRGPERYVLDVEFGRWTLPIVARKIAALQARWSKHAPGGVPKILVEKKATGQSVIDMLKSGEGVTDENGRPLKLAGVIEDSKAQRAHDDKMSRAVAAQPYVEGGNVALLRGPWVDAFLHEVVTFPVGSHDDQVDAFTMALKYWLESDALRSFVGSAKW